MGDQHQGAAKMNSCSSSQLMAGMSGWLVGSSSRQDVRSPSVPGQRHRRRQPPDSWVYAGIGGRRQLAYHCVHLCWRLQPSAFSNCCWVRASCSRSVAAGVHQAVVFGDQGAGLGQPCGDHFVTVNLIRSGQFLLQPGHARPGATSARRCRVQSPASSLRRVVLPVPLRPSRPRRSPR